MENSLKFKQDKYVHLQELIPLDLCRVVTQYALIKEDVEFTPEPIEYSQVANAHSVYADTLMETMLHFLHPHMEKQTGLSLCPTYTYYRVYRPGMDLKPHMDRPSCEISTTVCFGINYNDKPTDYRWGMYVHPGIMIPQNPGDLLIYRGCEVEHWREPFDAGAGSYQVQAFFHFIDKNGPYYPEFAYDNRPRLGWKLDNKTNK
tara:strand:- start:2747 stop:3355 length:609 start_codon:yes stop_codon:yes gene_type:complete